MEQWAGRGGLESVFLRWLIFRSAPVNPARTTRKSKDIRTSDINPYEPGSPLSKPTGSGERPLLRSLFFAINFAVAVLMFVSAAISIVVMESPGSFFGGIIAFVPFLLYGIAEWVAWYRQRRSIDRKLAYANLGCAAFVAFGVVATIGEVFVDTEPIDWQFLVVFTLIGLCIIVYLLACGWMRFRWTRHTSAASLEDQ